MDIELELPVFKENEWNELKNGIARLPEIVVYEHKNFDGWNYRTNLNVTYIGDIMNDKVSAFVIVSGRWQFFLDKNYVQPIGATFGPGYYNWVEDFGVSNDKISSFKCISPL